MNRNSDGVGYESGLTGQIFLFEFLELVEVTAGAQRRVHLVRVVEETVIHGVLARVFAERDERLEPVAPQDLRRQVRRASLRRHTRRLDGPLQNNDDFKLLLEQVRRRYIVQRRVGRDFVNDRRWPDEEDFTIVHVHGHLISIINTTIITIIIVMIIINVFPELDMVQERRMTHL